MLWKVQEGRAWAIVWVEWGTSWVGRGSGGSVGVWWGSGFVVYDNHFEGASYECTVSEMDEWVAG